MLHIIMVPLGMKLGANGKKRLNKGQKLVKNVNDTPV